MKPLREIVRKYKISSEDIQKLIQYLVLGRAKEAQIDGVIINKYHELVNNHCRNKINQKPETDLIYESPIQEWAMLYLESLEKELEK